MFLIVFEVNLLAEEANHLLLSHQRFVDTPAPAIRSIVADAAFAPVFQRGGAVDDVDICPLDFGCLWRHGLDLASQMLPADQNVVSVHPEDPVARRLIKRILPRFAEIVAPDKIKNSVG